MPPPLLLRLSIIQLRVLVMLRDRGVTPGSHRITLVPHGCGMTLAIVRITSTTELDTWNEDVSPPLVPITSNTVPSDASPLRALTQGTSIAPP